MIIKGKGYLLNTNTLSNKVTCYVYPLCHRAVLRVGNIRMCAIEGAAPIAHMCGKYKAGIDLRDSNSANLSRYERELSVLRKSLNMI